MSDPTKLDYNPDDFDDPNRHRIVMGDPTYAYRPMLPFDQRFPPIRKKEEPPKPSGSDDYKTYLIAAEGFPLVKIGLAKIPEARMATLQTGQPMTLSLLWSCEGDYERSLHLRFAEHRVRGEWFDLTPLGDPVEVVAAALEEIKAAKP